MITVISKQTADRWAALTKSMDIPADRREITIANIRWFIRNGMLKNAHHKNYPVARKLAIDIDNGDVL